MKIKLSFCFLLLCYCVVKSQLLIIDGSFEQKGTWLSASKGSPNFFEASKSELGKVQAPQGEKVAGLILYDYDNKEFREYIKTKFSAPLKKGEEYCVRFQLMLAPNAYFNCDALGVAITKENIQQDNWNILELKPNWSAEKFKNLATESFQVYHFNFTALGGEEYFYLGNFDVESETHLSIANKNAYFKWSYIFIDQVSVKLCSDTASIIKPTEFTNENLSKAYNPSEKTEVQNVITPNGDGLNDVFIFKNLPNYSQLRIYDKKKKLIYSSNNYKNNWDGEIYPSGAYEYELVLPNGNIIFGTLNIQRKK